MARRVHLFSDSEAYHKQMGPVPSSNRNYPMRTFGAIDDALFTPSTQQNWPRDRKLTHSCWCLHWFLSLRADVWKNLLQVHARPVVTQIWIEKMFNKNTEIGFQSAVFHLCRRAIVPLLCNDKGPNATASI